MLSHASIKLDNTMGAAFLGNVIAGIFYGITCVQTFAYYKRNDRDPRTLKTVIFILWSLDTIHMVVITHALYYYLVSNFGNIVAIVSPTWSILTQIYLTCTSDLIVRAIFGGRVWILAGRNKILAACIAVMSLATFVMGFAFTSKAFTIGTFANFHRISYFLYTGFACGVVADVLIAASLCRILSKWRTGFTRTDSLINVLMMYSINTSVLTTICTLAVFITYAILPQEFTFIGIYFSLSKLYLNSLLATLNGRQALWTRLNGTLDINMTPHPIEFATGQDPLERQASATHAPSSRWFAA